MIEIETTPDAAARLYATMAEKIATSAGGRTSP